MSCTQDIQSDTLCSSLIMLKIELFTHYDDVCLLVNYLTEEIPGSSDLIF